MSKKETWIGQINITPLLSAFDKFEKFRANDQTEQERAGTIQAFEYCFELSWKIMKRLLQENGKTAYSPRETFRMAALEGWIDDLEIWFEFIKKRNLAIQAYDYEELDSIHEVCPSFSAQLNIFLNKLNLQS